MESMDISIPQDIVISSEVYRNIDPKNFNKAFFKNGLRSDGRILLGYRGINVVNLLKDVKSGRKLSLTNGVVISSIRISLGNTVVHCLIRAVPTYDNKPYVYSSFMDDPSSSVNVSLTIPKYVVNEIYDMNGPCINISHIISNLIEGCLNSDNVLPKDQFLLYKLISDDANDPMSKFIKVNKLRWKLNFNLTCEEYDGNIIDASILSVTYALTAAKLPILILKYNDRYNSFHLSLLDDGDVNLEDCKKNDYFVHAQCNDSSDDRMDRDLILDEVKSYYRKLIISSLPYTVTFCKCDDYLLLDPTMNEEQIGINLTMYCLRHLNNGMNLDGGDDEVEYKIHPLNIMGYTDDINTEYYQITKNIVDYMKNLKTETEG